jgi:hypothetical protein
MIITHVALENGWNRDHLLQNAEKLILGSFNPFNQNGDNTDYYYGRSTNYFWKAIAELNRLNTNAFLNNLELKLDYMNRFKFCFLDVINSIEIQSDDNNERAILDFVNQKIFTEFSDQVLFTSNTSFGNNRIKVTRTYNSDILPLIEQGRIRTILHTMGNNTIRMNLTTKPKELRLGVNGFQGFINDIVAIENVRFVNQSFSPSGRAVNTGGPDYFNELKNWLSQHVLNG